MGKISGSVHRIVGSEVLGELLSGMKEIYLDGGLSAQIRIRAERTLGEKYITKATVVRGWNYKIKALCPSISHYKL